MKFYAVRMGDYVEFRVAASPPKARVSKITRVFDGGKVTLRTVFHVGGRVLGVVKYNVYNVRVGTVKFGKKTMVEVPKKLKTDLLRAVRPY